MRDPFVYKGTNVLINKLELTEQELLDQFESVVFKLSFVRLIDQGFKVTRASDIFILHKELFKDVYDWAGSPRTINIEKQERVLNGLSVIYEDKNNIIKEMNRIDLTYLDIKGNFIINLSKIISKIWKIHPFREGNTRTVVVFLYFLLKEFKLMLNNEMLEKHSSYFRNALVLASIGEYSEYEHLKMILRDAIYGNEATKDKIKTGKNKYEKIKDMDLKNYKYKYHIQKK